MTDHAPFTQEEFGGCHWCISLANSHLASKLTDDTEELREAVLDVHETNKHDLRFWPTRPGETQEERIAIATAMITMAEGL